MGKSYSNLRTNCTSTTDKQGVCWLGNGLYVFRHWPVFSFIVVQVILTRIRVGTLLSKECEWTLLCYYLRLTTPKKESFNIIPMTYGSRAEFRAKFFWQFEVFKQPLVTFSTNSWHYKYNADMFYSERKTQWYVGVHKIINKKVYFIVKLLNKLRYVCIIKAVSTKIN